MCLQHDVSPNGYLRSKMNFALCFILFVLRFSHPSTWEAYLGLHIQRKVGGAVVKKNLKQIIPHPNYNAYTFDNDIALMELDSPVTYSDYIKPICLPAPQHVFPSGNTVYITGWGATREGGESPQTLKLEFHFFGVFFQSVILKHFSNAEVQT